MGGETIRLDDGHARLTVSAEGGAILRYDALLTGRAPLPLMKLAEDGQAFGCQVLVPFSNRISGGGFNFDGRFHADRTERARRSISDPWRRFPKTMAGGEKLADVLRSWRWIMARSVLTDMPRTSGTLWTEGALTAHMEAENRAAIRLPYGLGFHPWFPRHPGTTLHAKAARVWLEDERHLPTGVVPIASRPQWDFSRPSLLPPAWVNNGFDGWDRRAEIAQSEDGVVLSIEASPELGVYILYSPSPNAGFFCFEPVSHVVDAHHGEGLTVLEPGATMRAGMRISWRPLG